MDGSQKKSDEVLLSISEAAELLGIAPSALRYYERNGLVTPRRSAWSNYRGYGLDELFELTDIVRYRNAGLAVKDLPMLFSSPIAHTLGKLDEEIDRKLDELEEVRLALSAAQHLSQRIRRKMELEALGWRLGSAPGFARLVRFETLDKEMLAEYLRRRDELLYAAFFPDPKDAGIFVDCACDSADGDGPAIWSARKDARYVEFLLTTDYGRTDMNDLALWRERLVKEGISIGQVIAEYLTYDVEVATGRRIDCYDAWAEVL